MNKWLGVRLCGWLGWCALILAGAGVLVRRVGVAPGALTAGAVAFGTLAAVLFFLWFAGSVLAWGLRRQGSLAHLTAEGRPAAPRVALCEECRAAPRVMLCSVHRLAVCMGCLVAHDSPACVYVPAGARAPASARLDKREVS